MRAQKVTCGDPVVVVQVRGTRVKAQFGDICSLGDMEEEEVDNINNTIVWGREPFNSNDTQLVREFRLAEPELLTLEEAEALRTIEEARAWFGDLYTESMLVSLVEQLKSLNYEHERQLAAA